ncbi:MAG: hypothetical protein HOV68_14090 [Streptomycetaceae bacterium]|nr:hypothetical protein [Streptomycetaceae bacterium]
MSELTRVTLETVAVVGIEGAPPEVRTALLRLTSLVPETLLPEGLDVAEDAFTVDGADLEDPYDAPEMTAVLGAVHADATPLDAAPDDAPDDDGFDEALDDSLPPVPFAGPEDLTLLVPGAADTADTDDSGFEETGEEDAVQAPSAARESEEPPASIDAFGEIPPATREDLPAQRDTAGRHDDRDEDRHEDRHEDPYEDADAVDAFGEIPPSTRDDVPVMGASRRAPAEHRELARAQDFEPTVFEPAAPVDDVTALVVPSWKKSGAPSSAPSADDVTVEVDAAAPAAEQESPAAPPAPAADGIVIPPRPTAPPPIPPRPTTAPPIPADASPAEDAEEPEETPASTPAPGNIVMVLAAWFTGREPRWRTLARDRMFTDSPRELSSLAAEFGKDATEVERLERALRRHLEDQIEQPGGAGVREHLRYVRESLGPVATVAELRDLDPRHTATVPGLGVQLWQVVRGLLDLTTSADGWLTAGWPGELESRTAEIVSGACERADGTVLLAALEPPLSALGVRPELREAWVARLDAFEVADGYVRAWPAEESGPVAAAPTVEAAHLTQRPAGYDDYSPDASAPDTDPGDAARCFRDDQGVWWYRVDVDTAQLDGERVPLPAEFVMALGLRPGDGLRLHHAAGPAALRWEDDGPYCVSLRTILAGLGAEDGDMVFIGSVRQGRLETRLLAGDAKLRLPRWARALRHTGVDPVPDQVNLPALLGTRLGLPDGCDLKAVLKRLQDRGDTDVLELLGVAQSH